MRAQSLIFKPSLVILIFSTCTLFAQVPSTKLIPKADETSEERSTYVLPKSSTEIPEQRGQYKKVYKTEDGRIIYQFSKVPLNYKSINGEWLPVEIKPITTFHGFYAGNQTNPVGLSFDGTVEIANREGSVFEVKTTKVFGEQITDEQFSDRKLNPALVTSNNQFFCFLTNQVVQRSEFRHNGIKVDYVLETPINANDGIIKQQLVCNSTMQLNKHPQLPNALSITNKEGEEMGILYPIFCKDASGNISLGEYSFQKNENGYEVTLTLNKDWINSSQRVYPVIVDPLIIGPTATFGTTYIPSCLMPAYGVDSLLVDIPGQTTITGVFCSGSYWAEPASGTTKSQGFIHFSSSCGQTADLSVYPPNTGWDTPGTAYGADIDYRNPLACCLGPSCINRTFYIRMHVGRNVGAAGCNLTYIYYDAFTVFPFSVYVEGRTIEATGTQWTVNPSTLCSDVCAFTIRPYVRYGVQPYTITHPWAGSSTSLGAPVMTCALSTFNVSINLTRPGCPIFCDTVTTVNIPLPTITDACGNTISGLPARILTINPTPQITVTQDSVLVCSNQPAQYTFTVCPAGTTVNWTTPGFSGTNSIDTIFNNPGPGVNQTIYAATATLTGCTAVPDTFSFFVSPNPLAGSLHQTVAQVEEPVIFTDLSNYFNGNGGSWLWTFGDGNTSPDSLATHAYLLPGTYNVCLYVSSNFGCLDTICDTIKIIPNNLILPNVLTTNGDGVNDALYFQYLPYYGISTLSVYNRWGEIVYESADYQNDWTPTNLVDGTYFYIIKIPAQDPYTSTLTIFNKS